MPVQILDDVALTQSPERLHFSPSIGIRGYSDQSDSDDDSDEVTLDMDFGHPLQRMGRTGSADQELLVENIRALNLRSASFTSNCSDDSESSSIIYDVDFDALIDDVLLEQIFPLADARSYLMVDPSEPDRSDAVMIKAFPHTQQPTPELYILLELNHPNLRDDPWNPIPHILHAVERPKQGKLFICMERLIEWNRPPLKTISNYIDLFRQVLEGMTFLHERQVVSLGCSTPECLMVDLGPLPVNEIENFDRTRYPVKYYFTNLSEAFKCDDPSTSADFFVKDVQECGKMIDSILEQVPQIATKMKSLVKAMKSGEFGAEGSRKLFEALCKSLNSSVFETPVDN